MRGRGRSERGQVLVMFAASLTILLGFSALVTDLGMLWAVQQRDRGMADAAALAGAQEMQAVGTRSINTAARGEARHAAMANVKAQTGGTSMPTCAIGGAPGDTDGDGKFGYPADIKNCTVPGTNYSVSVLTPSPLCVDCEINRSVMVEITHQNIPTFFAGLFGRNGWSIRQTAVAGIGWDADFAIMVLRPPSSGYVPSGSNKDGNEGDLILGGNGTRLKVSVGDIGTNTNVIVDGIIEVDEGYYIHQYDHYQAWVSPPPGRRLRSLIADPLYPYPTRAGAPPAYNNVAAARLSDAACTVHKNNVPSTYTWDGAPISSITDMSKVICLKPGIYNYTPEARAAALLLFTPGVYFLDRGLFIRTVAIGGFQAAPAAGVTLVFTEASEGRFDGNNAEIFAINAGTRFLNSSGTEAGATIGFDLVPVITNEDAGLKLTIMVAKDPGCVVQLPYPAACNDGANKALTMSGGGKLYLAGVQYAPSDNISIGGGAAGLGHAGRIVAWTIKYHGGVNIEQAYPGVSAGNGVIRLDAMCSGGGSTGMTNAACNP